MIELKITGCCDHCKERDLRLDSDNFYTCGTLIKVDTLHCIHEKVCGALAAEKESLDENLQST